MNKWNIVNKAGDIVEGGFFEKDAAKCIKDLHYPDCAVVKAK